MRQKLLDEMDFILFITHVRRFQFDYFVVFFFLVALNVANLRYFAMVFIKFVSTTNNVRLLVRSNFGCMIGTQI